MKKARKRSRAVRNNARKTFLKESYTFYEVYTTVNLRKYYTLRIFYKVHHTLSHFMKGYSLKKYYFYFCV